MVSEIWLQAKHLDSAVSIAGFQSPVRCDRPSGRGGGVAIYARNGLHATAIKCAASPLFQCTGVSVTQSRRSPITISVTYRPPDSDADLFIDFMDLMLSQLPHKAARDVCLVGDFNAKHSRWLPSQPTDSAGVKVWNFAAFNGLYQVVNEPTYTSSSGQEVLLDLMFVHQVHNVKSVKVLSPVADHCPTVVTLASGVTQDRKISRSMRHYDSADFDALRQAFSNVNWSSLDQCTDVDSAVSHWYNLVESVLNQHVPVKKVCIRPCSKPWYSPYLHKLAKQRDRLYRRSRGHTDQSPSMSAYRKIRNLYVGELRAAERRYYRLLGVQFSQHCLRARPHYWWSKLKSVCGWSSSSSMPPLLDETRVLLAPQEKAEALNHFFAKQCSAKCSPLASQPAPAHSPGLSFSSISSADAEKTLASLDIWKSSGGDQISARLLRECHHELAPSLSLLFNLSLSEEVYPSQWKEAVVVPFYKKKGNKSDLCSYRPISLLSCISKVFGRLVKAQLLEFCMAENVIPDCQFGFLPGRSTVWQLLSVMEELQQAMDDGLIVHALFLDISKAFDRVDHNLLLEKLRAIGLSQSACYQLVGQLSEWSINSYYC